MDAASGRRWAMLAAGMISMLAVCVFQYGLPFLVPTFRDAGLSLTQAGVLVSSPVLGVLASLVAWGVLTDRVGERLVLTVGLAGAGLVLAVATRVPLDAAGLAPLAALLALAGASGACVQVASGRLILGWFAPGQRGLAMGLRQMAQPLGVALAAATLPHTGGLGGALAFLAACSLVAAVVVAVVVRDPEHAADAAAEPAGSPYRGPFLLRVHLSSTLLVVPQFTVAAFAFDYLIDDRGWDAATAGPLLAAAGIAGGGMRLAVGVWSDRARSRLRPMRLLALGSAAVLLALAAGVLAGSAVAPPLLAVAAVLTVSTNGLSYTAVAERAGRFWAGRALGVQNTTQNLAAAVTPPAVAVLIGAPGPVAGYAAAFGLVVVFPLLAALVVPVAGEHPL